MKEQETDIRFIIILDEYSNINFRGYINITIHSTKTGYCVLELVPIEGPYDSNVTKNNNENRLAKLGIYVVWDVFRSTHYGALIWWNMVEKLKPFLT